MSQVQKKIVIPTDVKVDQSNYYWFKNGFTDADIECIETMAKEYDFRDGKTFSKNSNIRRSKIKWLHPTAISNWLYVKMYKLAKKANDACYRFRLHHAEDSMQYTLYEGENEGKYDWHIDIGMGSNAFRKLSAVLLLSDPTEFEGGLLQIYTGRLQTVPLQKGSVVFFPSFLLHRVTPVISGKRKTLVCWIGGDHYL